MKFESKPRVVSKTPLKRKRSKRNDSSRINIPNPLKVKRQQETNAVFESLTDVLTEVYGSSNLDNIVRKYRGISNKEAFEEEQQPLDVTSIQAVKSTELMSEEQLENFNKDILAIKNESFDELLQFIKQELTTLLSIQDIHTVVNEILGPGANLPIKHMQLRASQVFMVRFIEWCCGKAALSQPLKESLLNQYMKREWGPNLQPRVDIALPDKKDAKIKRDNQPNRRTKSNLQPMKTSMRGSPFGNTG